MGRAVWRAAHRQLVHARPLRALRASVALDDCASRGVAEAPRTRLEELGLRRCLGRVDVALRIQRGRGQSNEWGVRSRFLSFCLR